MVNWRYNKRNSKAVKHAFYIDSKDVAICGTLLAWFQDGIWASDEEGLRRRKTCSKCERLLVNQDTPPHPGPPPPSNGGTDQTLRAD